MKKLLLLSFVLFSFVSVGQIQQLTDAESKVLSLFKKEFVEKTFKDPYSFKLLKLEITPITKGDFLLNDIKYMESNLKEIYKYEPKEKVNARLDDYKKQYEGMSNEDRLTIRLYSVRLDCYGNNSYGNQILGRYKFSVKPDYSGTQADGGIYVSKI
jgi:hypothetical protein